MSDAADRVRAAINAWSKGGRRGYLLAFQMADALEVALEALETILLGCPPEAADLSTEHGADHQLAEQAIERMADVLETKNG